MRRPNTWLRWLLLICLLIVLGEYIALTWLAPQYVLRAVARLAGGQLLTGEVALSAPTTTIFKRLRLAGNTPDAALHIHRAITRLTWISLPERTVWFESLELERPVLRVTRTMAGDILWPAVRPPRNPDPVAAAHPRWDVFSSWKLHIASVKIVDGTIELIDDKPPQPFHGVLDHVSLETGAITLPLAAASVSKSGTSFAVRGEVIGDGGHAAPAYCSGWVRVLARDLDASCRLEPLPLAAFEPYFQGKLELRVYDTTLMLTGHWTARANQLSGRTQVQLDHLGDGGELSIRGHALVDARKLAAAGNAPTLRGEIVLAGPMDQPQEWHAEFLPGDEQVQQFVRRLLARGVEIVTISLPGFKGRLSITPASQTVMSDITATSREIQDALEILAVPPPEPSVTSAEPAAATPAAESEATGPSSPPVLAPQTLPASPLTPKE